MTYVLIFLFWGANARADHIEFSTKEACMFAAEQVQQHLQGTDRVFCVPKG